MDSSDMCRGFFSASILTASTAATAKLMDTMTIDAYRWRLCFSEAPVSSTTTIPPRTTIPNPARATHLLADSGSRPSCFAVSAGTFHRMTASVVAMATTVMVSQ